MQVEVTPGAVQSQRYSEFYRRGRGLRRLLRFDVRYRCRRTHEVLAALGVSSTHASVLDVGFGGGDLLASFPRSCALTGAEISASAVDAAREDARFAAFASATFVCIPEDDPSALPVGPFDLVVSAHTLEHVPDEAATLAAIRERISPQAGLLVLWVPIEEPDYIPFHVRAYSMQSIVERVRAAGMQPLFVEGSNHINGHAWKIVTIPSRRAWPIVGPAVDLLRLATLSMLGYRGQRSADRALHYLGVGPRQALVVARRR